ncbi:Uncharacterised protein [Klebsiella pneumoniae]|nr:Uncharacterised protein [Klebsiella pneumoniae]SVL65762.1 Uncharacterised protein [Klebsiella pneumoniae]SVP08567.1 Uncharacterised protein [Klebsiella pneumoniae]SVT71189.1 Uncharacterised protein [Klebsiella pneumoniae]SVW02186.1 Uncharacterised protein [Klebsiella pneumoniae]
MVLMLLVSDVILCDWLVIVFSTWLTRPVSELTAVVSAFLLTVSFVDLRLFSSAVIEELRESILPPWVFTVFWSVVIADAFASAFIITPPAAPSPIIIPFTNSTEVEM